MSEQSNDFVIVKGVLEEYHGNDEIVIVPDGVREISSNGNFFIGSPGFAHNTTIKKVKLPEGLTYIGNISFWGCLNLTEINIPDSVNFIEDSAFMNCPKLTKITGNYRKFISVFHNTPFIKNLFPNYNDFKISDDSIINYNGNDKEIIIPDSIASIEKYAFSGCENLTSITIHNSIKKIGEGAFWGCTGLNSIILPDSIISIETSTFFGCTNLKSIKIPNGVTKIGERAFCNCTALSSINLPESLEKIEDNAFYGCTSLTTVTGNYSGLIKSFEGTPFYEKMTI